MNWAGRKPRALLLLLCSVAPCATLAADAPSPAPAVIGGDWEGYNKTLDGQRFSPLSEINVSNAANLVEVCRVRLARRGSLQSGLVVIGDALFATTPTETFAIDPVTCHIKWQHTYHRSQAPGLQVNRGVAYLNGRVFRGTDDARLLALDAATGREIWTSVVGDPTIGEYVASAPVAWNGLVIVGISGGEFGIRGRLIAYDASSGREVWRFNTIPLGEEFGADTWGDSKWAQHGGGATWSSFTLDPVTAEVFAPIGNPVPDFAPRGGKQYVAFTSGNVSPTAFGSVGQPSIVVMSLPGNATSAVTDTRPDAARGKQIYAQLCAGCHGPEGDRIAGKSLKSVASRMSAEQLAAFIVSPTGTMPSIFPDPRTREDERDIRDVAAFVTSWSK